MLTSKLRTHANDSMGLIGGFNSLFNFLIFNNLFDNMCECVSV